VRIEALKIEGEKPIWLTGLNSDDVVELVHSEHFTWIDIEISSSADGALGQLLVERLDFHPATVSDCLHRGSYHQPKMDEEQNYRFITFIYYDQKSTAKLTSRELHAYVSDTYVITVHQHSCKELLEQVKQYPRVITDYEQRAVLFLHHILDMITDSFVPVLRGMSNRSDEMEMAILKVKRRLRMRLSLFRPAKDQISDMRNILKLRRSLVRLRRTLIAELEIVEQLVKEYDYPGAPESSEEIAIYYRDIDDHISKYLEIIEGLESTMNHLMEVHSMITGHRTNEIIYILTIISTVMLPLNLIVGFFGMNFENLWFSHASWGIWLVSAFMLAITVLLLAFFRAKEWI